MSGEGFGQLVVCEEDKTEIDKAVEQDMKDTFGSDLDLDLSPDASGSTRSQKMMERTPEPASRRTALRFHNELEPNLRSLLEAIKDVKVDIKKDIDLFR